MSFLIIVLHNQFGIDSFFFYFECPMDKIIKLILRVFYTQKKDQPDFHRLVFYIPN